jgi:dipeptidyl aminopeptidase/acylaminoacyl peptidase
VTRQCELIYDQNSTGWIELVEPPSVLKEDGSILTLASKPEGDDSFLHILEISPTSDQSWKREISPISGRSWRTTGKWEVTSIVAVTSKDILYISTLTNPAQRHLYSTLTKNCLTCSQEDWNLPNSSNPSIPSRCDYFSASCSPSLDHCLLSCSGPAVPYTLLVHYDGEKLTPVRLLEENAAVHEAISNVSLPTVDFFTIPASESGPSLNGQMMYPPGFKSSHQYPLLVYVYGGPYSQQVANRTLLSSLPLVYLCSNLSMIVAKVDGRGTGFRGDRFKFSVYKNLGHFETIDQIRAGRYLQNLKYVDSSKLAIYGSVR